MRISFFYEFGEIKEIGTGHKYRSLALADELTKRGHKIVLNMYESDVLIVDHLHSQKSILKKAKQHKIKTVLLDGDEQDVALADISISAFYNKSANYKGIGYMAFPVRHNTKYDVDIKSNLVFVGVGGFDANNIAHYAINAVHQFGLTPLIAKSINHPDWATIYSNIVILEGEDYYAAFDKCLFGITAGGLTLFQSLHYGLPIVAIPQYEHQKENIFSVKGCCISSSINNISTDLCLLSSKEQRSVFSNKARSVVDGYGVSRICDLIEKLKN